MIPWLDDTNWQFPATSSALDEPNGLLAAGGDLSVGRLVAAYQQGIFPWYQDDDPILWWSPSPRCVLMPEDLHISKSLAKFLRKTDYSFSVDTAFADVMRGCAAPRSYTDETWITSEMFYAYNQLFEQGIAHSIEVWQNSRLVGGLYGLCLGRAFFGESMFSLEVNASKAALVYLVNTFAKDKLQLIDCQVSSPHLIQMGASEIDRDDFEQRLHHAVNAPALDALWPKKLL